MQLQGGEGWTGREMRAISLCMLVPNTCQPILAGLHCTTAVCMGVYGIYYWSHLEPCFWNGPGLVIFKIHHTHEDRPSLIYVCHNALRMVNTEHRTSSFLGRDVF